MGKPFQFSLKELIVITVLLSICVGIGVKVYKYVYRPQSRQLACLNNLKQLTLICHIYSDATGNNGLFPNDGKSACLSLNLLFDSYMKDYRLFKCASSNATASRDALKTITPANIGRNLSNKMTDYGYDRRHNPDEWTPILLSDMGPEAGPGKNSTNHVIEYGDPSGQNVVDCSGAGRFVENTILKRDKLADDDIFQDDTKYGKLKKSEDSWIRND